MFGYFEIAESGIGSYRHLAILRWSLVIVFVWFGAEKFTDYAAEGIAPLIANSPIVSWLRLVGVGEASSGGFPVLSTVPGQFLLKDLA